MVVILMKDINVIADDKERETHDQAADGRLCLEFVNTVNNHHADDPRDMLGSYTELVGWARRVKILTAAEAEQLLEKAASDPHAANEVLKLARDLRATLYRVFSATARDLEPAAAEMAGLNRAMAKVFPHMQLETYSEGFRWGWQGVAGVLDAPLWPVIRSAAELLTSDDVNRTSECDGSNCTWLFIDHSKNHSRRWCDMGVCGNREKSRRHYARKRIIESTDH